MPDETVVRATFTPYTGEQLDRSKTMTVHFNPTSLQISISNTLEEKGRGNDKKQYVTKSSAKLTLDLIFDTTHDGADVRIQTEKISVLMKPGRQVRDQGRVPTVVLFEWGTFKFQGLIESYKETIDFFAPIGVPLRASINLTLASQEVVFETQRHREQPRQDPPVTQPVAGTSMTQLAAEGGDSRAGRNLAAANGQDSMRFPNGPIALSPDVQLSPPVAFASGGIGGGLSAGIGVGGGIRAGVGGGISASISGGISAGISAGISSGVGISGGVGLGAGFSAGAGFAVGAGVSLNGRSSTSVVIGSSASARVPATAGAFAGLRVSTSMQRSTRFDSSRFIRRSESFSYATGRGASFQVGGQAQIEGSASLKADVGASASLQSRLRFDGG